MVKDTDHIPPPVEETEELQQEPRDGRPHQIGELRQIGNYSRWLEDAKPGKKKANNITYIQFRLGCLL